ncbi:MAG: secretin N-terminal domain-containing protein, partial [Candidatus Binatia bacterium]
MSTPETPPHAPADEQALPIVDEPAVQELAATISPNVPAEDAPPGEEMQSPPPLAYTGKKISLEFKSADIHDVLRVLAEVSSFNIVATDDVKARVSVRLLEVPADQALDVILQANGLEKMQVGNVITVSTTQRLEAERSARLAAKNAEQKLTPLETAYIRVNYVKATDVIALITRETRQRVPGLGGRTTPKIPAPAPSVTSAPDADQRNSYRKFGDNEAPAPSVTSASDAAPGGAQVALLSPRGTIAADPTTNVVIIRDTREHIAAIRELIQNIDIQTPQVVVESYIVTANENTVRDLGIQWGYRYVASPETGNPTGFNFPGRLGLGGSGLGAGIGGVPFLGLPRLPDGTAALPFIADFPASAVPGSGAALDLLLGSLDGAQTLNLRLSALEREGKARVISRPRVV